jgi:glc operon protein GlcG
LVSLSELWEIAIRTRTTLTLSDAETVVAAAFSHARANGWAVSVAVLDDGGTPILVSRLDDATPISFNIAIEKARTAALTGMPTQALEAMIHDRPALLTMGRVAIEGGLPLHHQGQRVGGVGVSGVRSDQDAAIAQAGIDALNATVS